MSMADAKTQGARAQRIFASTGLLVGLALILPAPAQAQVYGLWGYRTWGEPIDRYYEPQIERFYGRPRIEEDSDLLTPSEVRDLLAYDGLRLKSPLARRGTTYVAEVTDRSGVRSRIIVDALGGAIIEQVALGADVRPPRDVPAEREFDMSEPRVVPGIGPRDEAKPPRVVNLPDAKAPAKRAEPARPAEKKPAPSQSMKTPKEPLAAPDRPKEALVPRLEPATAAAQPPRQVRQVYPAGGEPAAPAQGEPRIELPPPVPAPQITPNAASSANGVPVNPLE